MRVHAYAAPSATAPLEPTRSSAATSARATS